MLNKIQHNIVNNLLIYYCIFCFAMFCDVLIVHFIFAFIYYIDVYYFFCDALSIRTIINK